MAAVAKITCNEMSNRVTSEAIQLHGGFGFTDEYPVSRLYRGARYGTLGGGTTETLRDLIGKRIMDAGQTGAELLAYDMMSGG
jgi:alkylation response protein AidB-like acyl-CoA dehydrogenase